MYINSIPKINRNLINLTQIKVLNIVGARPQFIKASIVIKKLNSAGIIQTLIHTGQHYDFNMSDVFFQELKIDAPDYHLGVGSGKHGEQTGKMLIEIEKVLINEKPSLVIVYGDTNSTLAGALASSKLKIPIAHVEAGLRSFNKAMPEETNRVLTDHLSTLLFAPTTKAIENLRKESITRNVFNVGDVMLDMALKYSDKMKPFENETLNNYQLKRKNYVLTTIHREENTDFYSNLYNIFEAIKFIAHKGITVFFAVHPRTRKYLKKSNFLKNQIPKNLILNEPVPYKDMIVLEKNARLVITDSGGVQKEAYFFKTPAVIPRKETEWVEIIETGWNIITGANKQKIIDTVFQLWDKNDYEEWSNFYGAGDTSNKICNIIIECMNSK